MIGKALKARSFGALAEYLLRSRDGAEEIRVSWTAARNLATDDPRLAAVFMKATALQSRKVRSPAYHLQVTFPREDPVDRTIMERTADRVLANVGLREHEAVLVAHGDARYPHLHIMANRVHPTTGRTWWPWHDARRIREALDEVERELGIRHRYVLTRVGELWQDIRLYEQVLKVGDEAYRTEEEARRAQNRPKELEEVAKAIQRAIARADKALAAVYQDPESAYRAFAAAIAQGGNSAACRTMWQRPEQFGALLTVRRSDAFGLRHSLDDTAARAAAPSAAPEARELFLSAQSWREAAAAEARRVEELFERALKVIYPDPAATRVAFERLAEAHGVEEAAAALGRQPNDLGPLPEPLARNPSAFQEHFERAATLGIAALRLRALANTPLREAPFDDLPAFARTEIEPAVARQRAAEQELRELPSSRRLEARLNDSLERLLPREYRQLEPRLTAAQRALIERLPGWSRDLLGPEPERDVVR